MASVSNPTRLSYEQPPRYSNVENPPSVGQVGKSSFEQIEDLFERKAAAFEKSVTADELQLNTSQVSIVSKESTRLIDKPEVKEALNNREKEVAVASDKQLYMRQASIQQTPIMDFKKLTRPKPRKKAETKPKHLQDLQTSIDQAVRASNVSTIVQNQRKSQSRSRSQKKSAKRITMAALVDDHIESPLKESEVSFRK